MSSPNLKFSQKQADQRRSRVLIIESDAEVSSRLTRILECIEDVSIYTLRSIPNAHSKDVLQSIDLIILDPAVLASPILDAPHILDDPSQKCVLYSSIPKADLGLAKLRPGVLRLIERDEGDFSLASAIEELTEVISASDGDEAPLGSSERKRKNLSRRERETLEYLGRGYTLKQAASRLNIDPKTVETYKSRGFAKLGLSTRSELVSLVAFGRFPDSRRV